jgi:hypothetical protein
MPPHDVVVSELAMQTEAADDLLMCSVNKKQ